MHHFSPWLQVAVQLQVVFRSSGTPYALHFASQKFPQRCSQNSCTVCLIDYGPFSSINDRGPVLCPSIAPLRWRQPFLISMPFYNMARFCGNPTNKQKLQHISLLCSQLGIYISKWYNEVQKRALTDARLVSV